MDDLWIQAFPASDTRYTEESLKCLLNELKIGASNLERDDISGKVGLPFPSPCKCRGSGNDSVCMMRWAVAYLA